MQTKPQRQHRQLMVSKCLAQDCREPARHHIKRRWLLKVKAVVQPQVQSSFRPELVLNLTLFGKSPFVQSGRKCFDDFARRNMNKRFSQISEFPFQIFSQIVSQYFFYNIFLTIVFFFIFSQYVNNKNLNQGGHQLGLESTHLDVILRRSLLEDRTFLDMCTVQAPSGKKSHAFDRSVRDPGTESTSL